MSKIAPTLRLMTGYDRPGPIADTETTRQAWAELRALLAVARAAERLRPAVTCRVSAEMPTALEGLARALSRLARLSVRKGGKP